MGRQVQIPATRTRVGNLPTTSASQRSRARWQLLRSLRCLAAYDTVTLGDRRQLGQDFSAGSAISSRSGAFLPHHALRRATYLTLGFRRCV